MLIFTIRNIKIKKNINNRLEDYEPQKDPDGVVNAA
jgi:hypothetical protein